MPNATKFFILGMSYVWFLNMNSPLFTVYSAFCLMYAGFLHVSSIIMINTGIEPYEIFYLLGLFTLENLVTHSLLRFKIFAFLGGLISISGLILFLFTLRHIYSNKSTQTVTGPNVLVRHPLHTGLFLYIAGSCIYLGTFGTLVVFIWYLKTHCNKFKQLDSVYNTDKNYLAQTFSGIPFLKENTSEK